MIKTTILECGSYYHIYNRGNNSESVFADDINYGYFLQLWKKHISPVADTYAYCLLNNHFHTLIRIKELDEPDLAGFQNLRGLDDKKPAALNKAQQAFSNFFNAYAKAFNKKYNRTGKLFEERFKRKEIKNDSYFTQLIYYIHANPQKHGFIDDFRDYPYSSYQSFLSAGKTSLMRNAVLDWFGGKDLFVKYHEEKHRQLKDEKQFEIE